MRITEAHDYDLVGELIDAPVESAAPKLNLFPILASARPNTAPLQPMKCPICKKEVAPDGEFVPFCSERCKLIDLGNWASEKYVVSTPAEETSELDHEE